MICANCDYVLDPSFFTNEQPEAKKAATPVSSPKPQQPMPHAPAPVSSPVSSAPAAASRPVAAARPKEDVTTTLELMWTDFRALARELPAPDRLAFFAAVAQLLWCFLPWKDTAREGGVVGLMTLGAVVVAGAAATATPILYRHRPGKIRFDPMLGWVLQIAGSIFMVLWCLFCIRNAWDNRMVAGYESLRVPVSRPAFGAFVALVSAAASFAGTLWGLSRKLF